MRLVFLLFSLSLVYSFWFFNFHPNLGFDISYLYVPIVEGFPMPWAWSSMMIGDGMGGPVSSTLWVYFNQLYTQILLLAGVPYWLILKWFLMFPLLLIAVFGVFKLARWYKIDPYIASFFYVTNSYFLVIVDGGQLNLGFAYSMIPLCVWLFFGAIFGGFVRQILFALSVCFLGIWDLRINYILAIILGVYIIFEFFDGRNISKGKDKFVKKVLVTGLITLVIFLLINFYWIFPSLIGGLISLPAGYDQPSQVDFLSFSSLTHTLFLQQPHWYLNNFGHTQSPLWYFGIYPAMAFAALLLGPKNKFILLWSMIGLIGIFLAKGSQPPFGPVYLWLFDNIPGFSLFRDPSKFYLLIAISYTILIGYLASVIYIKTRWIYYLLFIIMLLILWPTYTGQMTGSFSKQPLQSDHIAFFKTLKSDLSFSRTFWIPTKPALGYNSPIHPSVEAFGYATKRPFLTHTQGEYERYNFLRSPVTQQLFDVAGIRYIFYPPLDDRKGNIGFDDRKYYAWFNEWFSQQPSFRRISGSIPLYELEQYSDHFFGVSRLLWIIGGDDYGLLKNTNLKLRDTGVVHVNEGRNQLMLIDRYPAIQNIVLLNKTSKLDLAMSFIDPMNLISLAKYIKPNGDDQSGWWSRESGSFQFIKAYLFSHFSIDNHDFDLGQGYAIAEGVQELEIVIPKSGKLFARVLESTAGGVITIDQKEINTKGEGNVFVWKEIDDFNKDQKIKIKTQGKINIINTLTLLTDLELKALEDKSQMLQSRYRVLDLDQLDKLEIKNQELINFQYINPSKYVLEIKGPPKLVVFSETYDPKWRLLKNGQVINTSTQVYGFINGFYVDQEGIYTVEYQPQAIVDNALIISGIGIFLILGLTGWIYYRERTEIQSKN